MLSSDRGVVWMFDECYGNFFNKFEYICRSQAADKTKNTYIRQWEITIFKEENALFSKANLALFDCKLQLLSTVSLAGKVPNVRYPAFYVMTMLSWQSDKLNTERFDLQRCIINKRSDLSRDI